jgi:hypothetical protein
VEGRCALLPIEDDRTIETAVRQALKDAARAMDWVLQREIPNAYGGERSGKSASLHLRPPRTTARRCFRHSRAPDRSFQSSS